MTPGAAPAAGLVVEDEPYTRTWLVDVLGRAFPGLPVTAVGDLAAARRWLDGRAGPGAGRLVALVDIGLPDGSGLDLVRELTTAEPPALAVVTTIFDDDDHLFGAIQAGAEGYLLKDHAPDTMAAYLRRIHDGEPPLSPALARRLLAHFRSAPAAAPPDEAAAEALTPRETEVLALLGRGLRTGEAARLLGLSNHTVASHVKAIYAKLNISSRAEAALEARNRGLA